MRSIIAGLSLAVLLFVVGCNVLSPHRRDLPGGGGGVTNNATPTVENLVKYLNTNAQRISPQEAITCTNVAIDVTADGQSVGLSGKMMCQTPRNFRLTGVVIGNPAVDIGSNKDEFWYWISKNQPPYLFHCSYDAMSRGARIPFPFQPDMVVTALGLAEYDANKKYEMKVVDNKGRKAIELIEQAKSPENRPIQKITVFDFNEARLPQPQILAYVLKDDKGNVICTVNIHKAQRVGPKGAIIPKEMVFNWPSQKLKMTMQINNPEIAPMSPEKAAMVFTRRNLGYQAFDLATRQLDGGLQRAGATGPMVPR
ncbi:MAG TPA: hypothetical protein VN688_10670 [Gemmataceae bacterium]|nr:hypothetical protein [Gemmataceae bacterium]